MKKRSSAVSPAAPDKFRDALVLIGGMLRSLQRHRLHGERIVDGVLALRREIESLRHERLMERKHPRGLVQREDDGRLALTPAERDEIARLFVRCDFAMGRLLDYLKLRCIRCRAAPMLQLTPGAKGCHGSFRCASVGCGLSFCYTTILRVGRAVLPRAADVSARSATKKRRQRKSNSRKVS